MGRERITIIRLSALGDVVCSLPVLAALHFERPEAEICWVVEDRFANLLEGHPWIHELVVFPRQKIKKMCKERDVRNLKREISAYRQHLRALESDWVLDLQGNLKSGVQSFLTGGYKRVGFNLMNSRECNWFFSNKKVKPIGDHVIDRNLSFLKPLGIEPKLHRFELHSPSSVISRVDELWEEFSLNKKKLALIHAGVSPKYGNKRWLPSRVAELGNYLEREDQYRILLTTGPGEEELINHICSMMKVPPVIIPPLSYRLLMELISRVDCMVGGDTGPTHIATVVGTPTVMYFGPTGEDYSGPEIFGGRSVTANQAPCSPCYRRECGDPVCMEHVTVDDVVKQVRHLAESEAR